MASDFEADLKKATARFDPDWTGVKAACARLAEHGGAQVEAAIVEQIQKRIPWQAIELAPVLQKVSGERTAKLLLSSLTMVEIQYANSLGQRHEFTGYRERIAKCLAEIEDANSVTLVIQTLKDESDEWNTTWTSELLQRALQRFPTKIKRQDLESISSLPVTLQAKYTEKMQDDIHTRTLNLASLQDLAKREIAARSIAS